MFHAGGTDVGDMKRSLSDSYISQAFQGTNMESNIDHLLPRSKSDPRLQTILSDTLSRLKPHVHFCVSIGIAKYFGIHRESGVILDAASKLEITNQTCETLASYAHRFYNIIWSSARRMYNKVHYTEYSLFHTKFDFTYLYGFYSKPGFSFHAGGADDGGICPSDPRMYSQQITLY
eukprot:SAG11_NODE_1880_length_4130_cov_2.736046_1_plen_176_part_00